MMDNHPHISNMMENTHGLKPPWNCFNQKFTGNLHTLSVEMPCSPLDVHPESISRPREHIIFIIIFPYIKVLHSHTNYIFPWTSPLNKLESFGLMQVIKVGSRLLRIALTEEVASITPEASPRTNCGPVRLWVLCIGMLPAK